jgi:hypothetical protein
VKLYQACADCKVKLLIDRFMKGTYAVDSDGAFLCVDCYADRKERRKGG